MPVPDFQSVMLPLLEQLADGGARSVPDLAEKIARHFGLSESERSETLPSGYGRLNNRVHWARTYLGKAGLIETPSRGLARITQRGRDVLSSRPDRIDVKLLERYPEFVAFKQRSSAQGEPAATNANVSETAPASDETPQEAIERASREIEADLADELLSRIKANPPTFFERLVVDLLLAMGYGGTSRNAGQVLGQSGDGGIDGVIQEDRLGLDNIYVQAKRWDGSVGRPVVQGFVGSLTGRSASKGVLITTGTFTQDAREVTAHLRLPAVRVAA